MVKDRFEIDGISIEILRKPIKNLHLRIYPPDGQVRVSAPLKLSLKNIQNQIVAKREWIHAQRARIQARPAKTVLFLHTGECHYFLGQSYLLNVNENTTITKVMLHDNIMQLWVKINATTQEKQAILNAWYREQMAALLPDLIKKWQPLIGVQVAEWGIKIMKTRWGSCNIHARRIWLNLNLITKPLSCLESVLVHEMVHLLEASHNARFYSLMDQFMPQWRAFQKPLKLVNN